MNRRLILAAGLSLIAAGCVTRPPQVQAPPGASLEELEPLYGASAGQAALTILVSSNGCTRKEDFAFFVERKGQAATLAFGRKKLDPCQSFAMGSTELAFTWEELGLSNRSSVFLMNPFFPWTGPGS